MSEGHVQARKSNPDYLLDFDGTVLEAFSPGGESRRFHISMMGVEPDGPDKKGRVGLTMHQGGSSLMLRFEPEEVPALERLLDAINRAAGG